jgi:tape measure domain-containing protein
MSTARVQFTADTRNFQQGVNGIQKSIGGLRVTVGAVATAFAAIGISNVASGLGGLVTSSSQAAASFETLAVQMEVLLGSADKAKKLVSEMKAFGATTPLEQKDIQQATKTLLQFGIKGEDVMGILKMLGDTSMGNADKLQTLSRAFGQMSSAGKSSMEDINMMIDAGFNPLNLIAARTGESMGSLRQRVSDGNVGIREITKAFEDATGKGGTFNNMLGRISETTEGKLSNLSDAVHALKVAFGTGLNVGLRDVLDSLNNITPTFAAQVTSLGEAAGKLLIVLAEKLPESVSQIESYITESGGIMNALKAGIVNVLQDQSVKTAVEELGRLMIPKELRESGIGQLAKTVVTGTSETSGALLAGGFLARRTPIGAAATAAGLTMMGTEASQKGGVDAVSGAMMGLGGISLGSSLFKLVSDLKTVSKSSAILNFLGLGGVRSMTGAPMTQMMRGAGRLGPYGLAAAAVGGLGGTIIGDIMGQEGRGNVTATPYIPSKEAFERERQRKFDKEDREAALKATANKKEKETIISRFTDGSFMKEFQEAFAKGLPKLDTKEFKKFILPPAKEVEMKEIGVSAAKPFLTSLASVGGGKFFTGKDTMASLQQTTNKFLQKIERNTKNIRATASWA